MHLLRFRPFIIILSVSSLVLSGSFASAQLPGSGINGSVGTSSSKLPPILANVGIDQKLNAQVPLDLVFRDSTGQSVTLRKYLNGGKQPLLLSLVYYSCPMLCPRVLSELSNSLKQLTLDPGKDYQVVTVSFDPKDTPEMAASEKTRWLQHLDRPGAEAAWHFLTGDNSSIQQLTKAVGFRFQWDPSTHQFAHATALVLLTPGGKVSKYFYGLDYSPTDLRLGLVQASNDKIGSFVDPILIFCCQYDASTGRYDLIVSHVLALAAAFTLVILGTILFILLRYDPNRRIRPG